MIDTTVFQNKTAVYYTLGCKLNFSETSTIGKIPVSYTHLTLPTIYSV